MLLLMQFEAASPGVGLAAALKFADEGFLASVGEFVCHHVALSHKRSEADRAPEGLVAGLW